MSEITDLKAKLIDKLIAGLEVEEGEIPDKTVLTTAARVVKDFQHEVEPDNTGQDAVRNQKLQSFLQRSQKTAGSA